MAKKPDNEQTEETPKKKSWLKELSKMEGAVDKSYNPFDEQNVIRSISPSLNWTFGKGSGLPFGFGMLLYGPPKSGKSLISYLMAAGLHRADPDAIVVKFNTEMREALQANGNWGMDPDRYMGFDVDDPVQIFDAMKKEILPMLQDGMPLKMIIIDSLAEVTGIKEKNRESVGDHLMGDHAKTIGDGLRSIRSIIRKHKIALVCTEQVRANLNAGTYGPKETMAGGWAEKHFFEYYMEVKRDGSSEGKESLSGEKFEGDIKDFRGNKDMTGHKIFAKMVDSSAGVRGRSGQFTIDYSKGLINIEDEIFELSKNLNIVQRPNNRTYIVGDKTFTSKEAFITAIKNDPELAQLIVSEVYKRNGN